MINPTNKIREKELELQIEQNKNLQLIIDKIAPLVSQYYTEKIKRLEEPKFKWTLIGAFTILIIIFIGSGILVYYGKVASENFTFLMGILVGGLLTVLGDMLLDSKQ